MLTYRIGKPTVAAGNTPGIYLYRIRDAEREANFTSFDKLLRVVIPANTSVRYSQDDGDSGLMTAYVVVPDKEVKIRGRS